MAKETTSQITHCEVEFAWHEEIKRGLSPVLKPGFFSAVEDIAADKAFVVYGGEETYRLKPGIEAIGLKSLQETLLAREQGGDGWWRMGILM